MGIERQRPTRFWLVAALSSALALALVPTATPMTLVPPQPTIFFGVSDRGTAAEFNEFADFVGKHPAVLQTFHPWGNSLNQALRPLAGNRQRRPILHISTADDQTLAELITPKADRPRPRRQLPAAAQRLASPRTASASTSGRSASRTAASTPGRRVNCDGSAEGGSHTRPAGTSRPSAGSSSIVRGGGTLEQINATLAEIRLPPLNRRGGSEPRRLAPAPVSDRLEPAARRLAAGRRPPAAATTGPGQRWVDWVGTDFYSQYPRLERPQPLLPRQAVERQAVRAHRVGGLRR